MANIRIWTKPVESCARGCCPSYDNQWCARYDREIKRILKDGFPSWCPLAKSEEVFDLSPLRQKGKETHNVG